MIGLHEIWRRKVSFGLTALVISLVAYLVLVINGLGLGLRTELGGAIEHFDATSIAYGADSRLSLSWSELTDEAVNSIRNVDGVEESAAVGYLAVTHHDTAGGVQTAALFGYDPGTIAEPAVVGGRALTAEDRRGLLVDRSFLADYGFAIGDSVTVIRELREEPFEIIGVIDQGAFGFLPAVYLLRETWRELKYGPAAASGQAPVASIVLLKGTGLAGQSGPSFEIVSKPEAFEHIEGIEGLVGMIWLMRIASHTIGAGVVGVFVYILTLQKRPNIGLLKALGASNRFVAGQTLFQGVVVIGLGLALAVAAAITTQYLIDTGAIGIILSTRIYATTGISLAVTGLLAVAVSIVSIARVDPIIALAQQQ